MTRLFFVAVLLAAFPAFAADDAKPNTLTPKEIAEGWLLLFDGETAFGWNIEGNAKVDGGWLILGGDRETRATTTTSFPDSEIRFECKGGPNKVLVQVGTTKDELPVGMSSAKVQLKVQDNIVSEYGWDAGGQNRSAREAKNFKPEKSSNTPVAITVPAGSTFAVRNFMLRPINLKSIFNGKDLTGWKEHSGKKSKFSVKDGTITVKDGPGDLQTEGQWADFVFQGECFSNGKHLNSGIFFRCLPDQYQQGYESQIHNGWLSEPTKEYAIETFDLETGKLTKSEKVKSAAMDYGTGAIYRRIPARKAVAKDGEWFTMTVAAQGRHIATWTNGIQVVDWTDTRPVKDNARNGCKLEKGNISIQGHDPTTDLSFRNFRIAELPGR
jgi:Domain of Unknown Function (DUF1080)